jgi:hypothetical protein
VGIDDQTGHFIVFVGNDGLLQELLEGNVGERNPRRNHLLGAVGSDRSEAVAGTRRRGLGQEIAKVVEDVGGGAYGVPIDHVRSGPSAPSADSRRKAYHLARRSATKRPLVRRSLSRLGPRLGRQCILPRASRWGIVHTSTI